ncbi:N-acetylglucosamine kinase [Pedobacter hiemivivus]|uniref:N-acetylglucosamine kinase n=1 Tax=Pedobacter hiemivivus TaxID=2530454 RepID=A0A4U1GPY1_9SPHI|nr:N-acetylglucosamine kinase [Pedobacter hiemivivus]TCC98556.1 N-acetylglucosamine kinase [Pedobacter hiemivivus]TKC65213.1 N-acetylglucosamine kinase [Pedobacter hiemivivus]
MILIADSGSTKTDWCLLDSARKGRYFITEGYNPYFCDEQYIINSIKANLPGEIDRLGITAVHFYGAGCQDDKVVVMEGILRSVFSNCEQITAEVDLLAAARGLLGNKPGFAAILGTGTNTCIYDGNRIINNVDSLGFILGDEGSGAAIGKRILRDYLRNKMPESVKRAFYNTYELKPADIIHKIYGEPLANRFCASFTRFLKHPEVDPNYGHQLVKSSFTEFFHNLVSCYPDYNKYTFNCIGSVSYHFAAILEEVLNDFQMEPGRILPSLIAELVSFHAVA